MNIIEAVKHLLQGKVVARPNGQKLLPGADSNHDLIKIHMKMDNFFADDWEVLDGFI
jgi:hypothetical protein